MMAPLRILIVEDERLISQELRQRLSRMGHVVVGLAASGEEAITQAQRLQPDLVLMDVRLRGPWMALRPCNTFGRSTTYP